MSLHNFIFTKHAPGRYFRHIIFWMGRLMFSMFCLAFFYSAQAREWSNILNELKFHSFNLTLAMVYSYPVVYFLYPKYLQEKKYWKFSVGIFVVTIIVYSISYVGISSLWKLDGQPFDERIVNVWHFTVYFFTAGPPVVCCLILLVKMLKNYYFQMENKAILSKENANAELQLLKAQVHPHFLFNTLNNIYSFTLNKSPYTKDLIAKLTDTLKYMIHDCEEALVPLEKELKMIQDYIGLEKVRYDKRLHLDVTIEGDVENKMIAPLFLIPFVENSFKHGSSRMLENPWIDLKVFIDSTTLHLHLRNSKPVSTGFPNNKAGIGLKNVQKRLQLLYPDQHELVIKSTDKEFSVYMEIPLQQIPVRDENSLQEKQILRKFQNPGYV